jgi:hypothetical protein
MRDGLGDLGLGKAIVHTDGDMAGELRHLTIGDQSADRDQAAIARREVGSEPQIAEQDVGRVLHDAREHCAELIIDALGAIGFRGLVERQQRGRCGRQLIDYRCCAPQTRLLSLRRPPDGPAQGTIVNLTDHRAEPSRSAQLEVLASRGPDGIVREFAKASGKPSLQPDLPHLVMPAHHDVRSSDVFTRRLHGTLAAAR